MKKGTYKDEVAQDVDSVGRPCSKWCEGKESEQNNLQKSQWGAATSWQLIETIHNAANLITSSSKNSLLKYVLCRL